MDSAEKLKPELVLAYSPNDIPKLTGGAISRSRVFVDIKNGKLAAKKAGQRTLITPEEMRRYIDSLPDRPTKPAA